ncbi:MAG: uracil-DNA glycosylase [Phycisphaera sp.]|nr:uracil-DNA glycosylase [Phycisphaera sp.]
MESLHADDCEHCGASTTHQSVVFGEGDPRAAVMFVGEAPGAEEDRLGRPFVGPAGELLDRMIDAVGLSRGDVYIGNVIKVRPPENRTPRPDECELCGPWLLAQVAAIRPRVVVALGATPTKYLLRTSAGITRLRGCRADIRIGSFAVPVVPTFHPSYVLRQYTAEVRRAVWEDLKQAVGIAGSP